MRNLGDTLTPHKYTATFIRTGTKHGKATALMYDVTNESGKILTDHIWLVGGIWRAVKLTVGDIVEFLATPYRYIKGYSGSKHAKTEFQTDIGLCDVHVNGVVGRDDAILDKLDPTIVVDDAGIDAIASVDEYKDLVNSQFKVLSTKRARRREWWGEQQKQIKKERKRENAGRNSYRHRSNRKRRRNDDDA